MENFFDPGELAELTDNPGIILLLLFGGGGGILAVLMIISFFTAGDVSDLIWGMLLFAS